MPALPTSDMAICGLQPVKLMLLTGMPRVEAEASESRMVALRLGSETLGRCLPLPLLKRSAVATGWEAYPRSNSDGSTA